MAIVTGASAGLGWEIARQLAQKGRPVLAVARRLEKLQQLADEAKAAGWATVTPFAADLVEEGAAEKVRFRARELGGAAWLVNNAGVIAFGPFLESTTKQNLQQIRLNCEAVVTMTQAILPDLLARKTGVILNVASSAGFQATPFMTVYGATKAFALSFTEGLSEELRATGITLTALCPGPLETEIFDVSLPGVSRRKVAGELSVAECARIGIEAAERGQVVSLPGSLTYLKALASKLMPRSMVRMTTGRLGLGAVGLPRTGKPEA